MRIRGKAPCQHGGDGKRGEGRVGKKVKKKGDSLKDTVGTNNASPYAAHSVSASIQRDKAVTK